jgi:hypothetical protein
VSRRKRQSSAEAEPAPSQPAQERSAGAGTSRRLLIDLAILTAVFAATVGIAELAGAANLGVAIGVGQVTFALALVVLLLRA